MRVLIADDNPAELLITRLILEELRPGIAVQEAHNGEEVLKKLGDARRSDSAATEIDFVLLDVNMPVMTGLEVLRALQGVEHPPIVVLTGSAEVCRRGEPLQLGAEDCRQKPIDLHHNEHMLREIVDRWVPTGG